MAATVQTLILEGQSGNSYMMSVYCAGGDLPGVLLPVSSYLAAGTGSPRTFSIPEPCWIKYLTGPTTGTVRILADGVATPLLMNLAAVIAKAADGNIKYGLLRSTNEFGAKTQYSIAVEVALAA